MRSEYLRSTIMGAIHSIAEQSSEEISEKRSIHNILHSNRASQIDPIINVMDQMITEKNDELMSPHQGKIEMIMIPLTAEQYFKKKADDLLEMAG